LRAKAKQLGLNVTWGARNAVLYELGALGAFVAHTLTNPPDPKAFRHAAEDILSATEKAEGWMYHAKDPAGKSGTIRYLIWSDMFCCPSCGREETLWDSCVSLRPAHIASTFTCPSCGRDAALDEVKLALLLVGPFLWPSTEGDLSSAPFVSYQVVVTRLRGDPTDLAHGFAH
jgi:hypothetical protein